MTARSALLCSLLLLSCPLLRAAEKKISLPTSDGCSLEALYLAPSTGAYVFVNTHGLGSDKNEWGRFDAALEKAGFGYLSLDLRGHGASLKCGGRAVDYRNFGQGDWGKLSGDIRAAVAFLKARQIPARRVVLCGASIGANLSAKAAAEGPAPAGIVLLSPGLAYAGVALADFFPGGPGRRFFAAASPDDGYAWESSLRLARLAAEKKISFVLKTGPGGHGTKMFDAPGSALADEIIAWARALK
jgi:pimeloyl-ACP methyl ester carboxylesterase